MLPEIDVVDFETFKIEDRPDYPPVPVGVAIQEHNRKPKYYAWGHPVKNNCTKAEAVKALKQVWNRGRLVVFHNAKFDLDVAHEHMGVKLIPKGGYGDTEFLAFLNNPYESKLSLKPLSETYLDMPPEEQDELHDWILENIRTSDKGGQGDVSFTRDNVPWKTHKVPPSKAGAFIAYAPGDLVGRYAKGDVERTGKLFKYLYPIIVERGELQAYEREIELMPVLLKNERGGVKVNERGLKKDLSNWEESIDIASDWIRRRLKASRDLNIDSGNEFADALEASGKISDWILTPAGNRSTSKENIMKVIDDPLLAQVITYRAKLLNSIQNFGRPWTRIAAANNGFIHTNWHQVRSTNDRGKGKSGARTGRLSSSPNFQNIPKNPEQIPLTKALDAKLCELPNLRKYIIPDDKSQILLNRDYSQQELRVMAHYEDGPLLRAYQEDPNLDIHELARVQISQMLGMRIERKPIKTLGFGLIYGMGLGLLAESMGVDVKLAKQIKRAYLAIFPGLRELDNDLKERGRNDDFLTTWGGRRYYVEPPKFFNGRKQTYEYKLLNYLIQGSSADCTKQALINMDSAVEGRVLLSVHDEIMISTDKANKDSDMKRMREAMLDVDFDVQMISDGKWSAKNWGEMKKYKE